MSAAPRRRAAAWLLALGAFGSLASLERPLAGWGVNSRLALVFAVVDEGRFAIDSYHDRHPTRTGDKARFRGHFYSDKIFGVSLLALPVYAGLRGLGLDLPIPTTRRLLRSAAVSLPAALSLPALWALLCALGATPAWALAAVAFCFWGSLWLGFASAFFPYAPGIACSLWALRWIVEPPAGRLGPGRSAVIGLLCGYAILCDLSFGLPVLGLVALFLLRVAEEAGVGPRTHAWPRDVDGGRPGAALAKLAAGAGAGLAPLALFVAYTTWIFGRPSIPYEFEHLALFREEMARGLLGVTWPRAGPLWFLTFHPYRGLFFWSPVFLLAVAGLVRGLAHPGRRRLLAGLGLWSTASLLLFNAGYYMWWGGHAMGPRFLLPMLAAMPLGLAEWLRPETLRSGGPALVGLGLASVALSAPVSMLEPELPPGRPYALLRHATPTTALGSPPLEAWRQVVSGQAFLDEGGIRTPRVASFAASAGFALAGIGGALRALRRRVGGPHCGTPATH